MRLTKKINPNLGLLVLSLWLIATGLSTFVPAVRGLGQQIPAILATAAGVLLLVAK